jgi:hypothetical protein
MLLFPTEDMQRFVASYPAFRQKNNIVSKHVAIVSELARLVERQSASLGLAFPLLLGACFDWAGQCLGCWLHLTATALRVPLLCMCMCVCMCARRTDGGVTLLCMCMCMCMCMCAHQN